jgi:small subunit ribosomal protein S1
MTEKKVISASIIGYNKHGLIVPLGNLKGFIRHTQFCESRKRTIQDTGNKGNYQSMVGQPISFIVIEVDRNRKRLTLSERLAEKEKLFGSLQVGTILDCHVVKVEDFGVFVDLGGVISLIHISEIGTISECGFSIKTVKKGQLIRARVLSIDMNKKRINLSAKFP